MARKKEIKKSWQGFAGDSDEDGFGISEEDLASLHVHHSPSSLFLDRYECALSSSLPPLRDLLLRPWYTVLYQARSSSPVACRFASALLFQRCFCPLYLDPAYESCFWILRRCGDATPATCTRMRVAPLARRPFLPELNFEGPKQAYSATAPPLSRHVPPILLLALRGCGCSTAAMPRLSEEAGHFTWLPSMRDEE